MTLLRFVAALFRERSYQLVGSNTVAEALLRNSLKKAFHVGHVLVGIVEDRTI